MQKRERIQKNFKTTQYKTSKNTHNVIRPQDNTNNNPEKN